jgi:hypothetical protein
VVEAEAERRQLHADVRAEAVFSDRVEGAAVGIAQAGRLFAQLDLLAEHVEGGLLPVGVQLADDVAGLGEGRSGDVTAGKALDDGPRHGRQRSDDCAVEDGHGAAILVRHTRRAIRASGSVTLECGWWLGVAPSLVALRA